MKSRAILGRHTLPLIGLLVLFQVDAPIAFAESPVKLQKLAGLVDFSTGAAPAPFVLKGNASHLGVFTAYGEADFVPGPTAGTLVGEGIVVFTAANGDLLVGEITWNLDQNDERGQVHASWRDAVQFGDGTIVASTGRFVKDRPPGFITSIELAFIILTIIVVRCC
jgi:hypothetical protein